MRPLKNSLYLSFPRRRESRNSRKDWIPVLVTSCDLQVIRLFTGTRDLKGYDKIVGFM